jgi:hypothetical protein
MPYINNDILTIDLYNKPKLRNTIITSRAPSRVFIFNKIKTIEISLKYGPLSVTSYDGYIKIIKHRFPRIKIIKILLQDIEIFTEFINYNIKTNNQTLGILSNSLKIQTKQFSHIHWSLKNNLLMFLPSDVIKQIVFKLFIYT